MKSNIAQKQDYVVEPSTAPFKTLGDRIERYVADHKSATMGLVMKTRQNAGDAGKKE